MRRRVPDARRTGPTNAENDETVANDVVDADAPVSCDPGSLPRPSHLLATAKRRSRVSALRRRGARLDLGNLVAEGASGILGRYGSDTVSEALVAGWGMREISSILRWALADLAVALLEVERRMALESEEKSGGARRRPSGRN